MHLPKDKAFAHTVLDGHKCVSRNCLKIYPVRQRCLYNNNVSGIWKEKQNDNVSAGFYSKCDPWALIWFIICIYFTFQQQDMVKGESMKLVQQSARLAELENETDIQLNSCTSPILINWILVTCVIRDCCQRHSFIRHAATVLCVYIKEDNILFLFIFYCNQECT